MASTRYIPLLIQLPISALMNLSLTGNPSRTVSGAVATSRLVPLVQPHPQLNPWIGILRFILFTLLPRTTVSAELCQDS